MKKVNPQEIKMGAYYIIKIDNGRFVAVKRRIKYGNSDEIWGEYVKILKGNMYLVGEKAFSRGGDDMVQFYSLTEDEAFAYMI